MKPKQIDIFQAAGMTPPLCLIVDSADMQPVDWTKYRNQDPDRNQQNLFTNDYYEKRAEKRWVETCKEYDKRLNPKGVENAN